MYLRPFRAAFRVLDVNLSDSINPSELQVWRWDDYSMPCVCNTRHTVTLLACALEPYNTLSMQHCGPLTTQHHVMMLMRMCRTVMRCMLSCSLYVSLHALLHTHAFCRSTCGMCWAHV